MAIHNDAEFKTALNALPVGRQRQVAARFVAEMLPLSSDPRVKAAVELALRPDISEAELAGVFQSANTARVESFTQCGKECDWSARAAHFVAEAATACVKPAERGTSLAWEAAMDARMARASEAVAQGQGTDNAEAEKQYRILDAFLGA